MIETGNTWEVKGSYKPWWKCVPPYRRNIELIQSFLSMIQTGNTWEVKGSYKRWWQGVSTPTGEMCN
jgi:hypothetical protein